MAFLFGPALRSFFTMFWASGFFFFFTHFYLVGLGWGGGGGADSYTYLLFSLHVVLLAYLSEHSLCLSFTCLVFTQE